ncbi:MAG: Phosphoserine phosphatase RsbU [candidate division BRC1 bacterium ADurb.BinA364]|nr:MAG: Phosphoserine phosphatase RsbU [candidate division BRC1 bacterium ADurb.BinA364]
MSAANLRLNEALRQIDNELRVVAGIQRALLPQALPHSDTLRFGVFYQPSTQCGGDYYDIYPLSPSVFGLVIADVSGHGAPAMVAMALVRLLFHSYASAAASPADLLGVLNNQLYRHLPTEQYATMFFGALDSATGLLTYSSAGQPPPLFCRAATGEIASLPNCEGFPLKLVMPDVEYQNHTLQMAPGDKLLLYTDGVNEMMDPEGELYGFERLCDSVGACMALPPQERIERIAEDLRTFARGYPQSDDVTMLWADLS